MGAVHVFTADRMKQIEDTTVISGLVGPDGRLLLNTRAGDEIDAGNVVGPMGPKGDQGADGVQGSSATPAGTITLWASDVAPANWLICDGSAVSRTTYASLFATIGTKYGAGDGVNTFNLPNLKGQTPVGKDATQTEFANLNQKGGEKAHKLTVAEMPSHTHGVTDPQHNHGITDPGHYHGQVVTANTGGGAIRTDYTGDASGNSYPQGANTYNGVTNISIQNKATGITNQNTGGDGTHNVLQPYTVVNFIIKFTNGDSPNDSQLTQRVSTLETFTGASPAGTITIWGGDSAPTNWMICDGAAISRTTYASLFAAIGTKYGAGDGSTTFNLPNFKGRTPTGLDATQTEFNALGKTGGEKTHLLTKAEMPSHSHGGATGQGYGWPYSSGVYSTGGSTNFVPLTWGGSLVGSDSTYQQRTLHTHPISADGSDTPHNNLQPYLTVNYIIKFTNGDTQGDSQLTKRVSTLETRNDNASVLDRELNRLQRVLSGGGVRKVAAGGISWTQPFVTPSAARDANVPSGTFVAYMPPNGTVVPVYYAAGGVTSATVANGIIPLTGWQALYYEIPFGQVYDPAFVNRYRILDYTNDQAFTVPSNWLLICARVNDGVSPYYTWGDGRAQDFWHTLGLLNSWVNYGGGYPDTAYRMSNSGKIEMRGLIRSGAGVICNLPAGLAPDMDEIFNQSSNNTGTARVDIRHGGDINVFGYGGGGTNAYISLSGMAWYPAGS